MDADEFRRVGHQLIDWIADYRAEIAGLPVMSRSEPGSIRAQLDGRWMVRVSIGSIPTEREHVEALWDLMRREAEQA